MIPIFFPPHIQFFRATLSQNKWSKQLKQKHYRIMLARHPITGEEIRVLKTETLLSKNKKTLLYYRPSIYTNAPQRITRYDTIVFGLRDAQTYFTTYQTKATFLCLRNETKEDLEAWATSNDPQNYMVCFLTKQQLELVGLSYWREHKINNILCLEEINVMYPHISIAYNNQTTDEQIVSMVGTLFRKHRVVGFTPDEISLFQTLPNPYNITYEGPRLPSKLVLLQQYFVSDKPRRQREIQKCLQKNVENPLIDEIHLLNEKSYAKEYPSDPHGKVKEVVIGKRLKYSTVVQYIQESLSADTIVAFANSDIYLDSQSLVQLWALDLQNVFISLLRYEESTDPEKEAQLFGPRADSQDTWFVYSDSVKQRAWDFKDLDFEFGRGGCDNAINVCFLKQKFLVANPALSLKTYHVHHTQYRTYNPKDIVQRPMYLHLNPTGLSDMNPNTNLQSYRTQLWKYTNFARKIECAYEKHRATFCTMIERGEKYKFEAKGDNITTLPSTAVYNFTNTFQTDNGLVYDYRNVFLGKHDALTQMWEKNSTSALQQSLKVPQHMLAIPYENDDYKNVFLYLNQYLSHVFYAQEKQLEGDFWISKKEQASYLPILQYFRWEKGAIPAMPHEPHVQAFAPQCTFIAPETKFYQTREYIAALRSKLRNYISTVDPTYEKKAVVVQDDKEIDVKDAYFMEELLQKDGYSVEIIYPGRTDPTYILEKVMGASLLITPGNKTVQAELYYFLLPKGATVIEIQQELEPYGEGVHYAGACELQYMFMAMIRGKKEVVRETFQKRFTETYRVIQEPTPSLPPTPSPSEAPITVEDDFVCIQPAQAQTPVPQPVSSLPTIVLPGKNEGFHHHAGDSFRELVKLWESKGYCQVQVKDNEPFCWYNDVLLYDRPNLSWYESTRPTYKKALLGNPGPTLPNSASWTFWARKPALLESLVDQNIGNQSYKQRSKTLVFYGKTENAVQASHRNNAQWESVCDDWFMAPNESTPYKYDHETYYRNLASSKYGLCLAGFGKKCHREVENMAFGTVPVVAPEVDMAHYANPPVENVHYFRVKTPSEAITKIALTSEETWTKMSEACKTWWKENCSAQGSWNLTQKLCQ